MSEEKLKNPSGLTLHRTGYKFVLSWKQGNNYTDQQVKVVLRYGGNNWSTGAIKISKNAKSYGYKLDYTLFLPIGDRKLKKITIYIRGKFKGKWTDWKSKDMDFDPPRLSKGDIDFMTVEYELVQRYKGIFSWEYSGETRPVTRLQYESILVPDCPDDYKSETLWKNPEFKDLTNSMSDSWPKEEDSGVIANKSYTRLFRIRACSFAGYSNWKYISHVYAAPRAAINVRGHVTLNKDANTQSLDMRWETPSDARHPIDEIIPQYLIDIPDAGMVCPDSNNWVSRQAMTDTSGEESDVFSIDEVIGYDKCLFVRVLTKHDGDNEIVHSLPVMATGDSTGLLKAPTIDNVAMGDNAVTIEATNTSDVEDSFLMMYYVDKNGNLVNLGRQVSGNIYAIPDLADKLPIVAAVKAVVGENIMQSAMVYSAGSVPLAPSNLALDQSATVKNTVTVTWDWNWDGADACEISWSEHEDAWDSTDEPDTYIVTKAKKALLNISDVSAGVPLYVRARFIKGTEDEGMYSPYSDIASITISSVPQVPTLQVNKDIFIKDEPIVCSWVYVTNDGTEQIEAEIAEYVNGAFSDPIAKVHEEQTVTLENKYTTGTQHALAVRVCSGSRRWSEWSSLYVITVAEELECEITQTNLSYEDTEINPETYSGDPATFIGGDETNIKDITSVQVPLTPKQDLHGYDKPWAGGNGKNKLGISGADVTSSGITFSVQADGTIKATGTLSGSSASAYFTANIPTGSYVFNDEIGGSSSTYWSQIVDGTNWSGVSTGGGDTNFSITTTSVRVYVATKQTPPTGGLIFKPMMRLSGTSAAWEPYTNICPITGASDVDVNVSGKNLIDASNAISGLCGYQAGDTINTVIASTRYSHSKPIPAKDGVVLSFRSDNLSTFNSAILECFDDNGKWVRAYTPAVVTDTTTVRTATVPANTYKWVQVNYGAPAGGVVGTDIDGDIQLEYGDTTTDYEPYNGNTTNTSLGTTVYGGSVDVVAGTGTEEYGVLVFDGTQNLATSGSAFRYYDTGIADGDFTSDPNVISSWLENKPNSAGVVSFGQSGSANNHNIYFYNTTSISGVTDLASFKTYLSNNPLTVVYKKATPTTLTLTPTDIEALLGVNYVWSEQGEVTVRIADAVESGYKLKRLPLTIKVVGAKEGNTTLKILRDEPYRIDRPDGEDFRGYLDEAVYSNEYYGEDTQSIDLTDLIQNARLDDGAMYRIEASVRDTLKQSATAEPIHFVVDWEKQAVMPNGTVEIEDGIAKITPISTTGAHEDDYIDIFRLSTDTPKLVYSGAHYGETIVDPYPTIGENGGYLLVLNTVYGDSITEDNRLAWTYLDAPFESKKDLIDFNGERIELFYNVDKSHSWNKDSRVTKYLGGTVVVDYKKGVMRTGAVSAVAITIIDNDMIMAMRRMLNYQGPVHIRTRDGSSFTADIQGSQDYTHDTAGNVTSFSCNVTACKSVGLEGMTLGEWENELE